MVSIPAVTVRIDADRLRRNVEEIRRRCGVEVWAVVKADSYGLGARRVAPLIGDVVDGFCVFSLREAAEAELWRNTGRPAIALGPPDSEDAEEYLAQHVRPAVSAVEQARQLRAADPIVCVDTGMQRFACPEEQVAEVIEAGSCQEAFTHATKIEHVRKFRQIIGDRPMKLHAAASGLLDEPEAWLDAVRPGLAIYEGAVSVRTRLIEVHESGGPVGYTQFRAVRHGVIPVGYALGLRRGVCLVNGQRRAIPEVGMQTAYVELGAGDRVGDEVVLLGEELSPRVVAEQWRSTPHEVLVRLAGAGPVVVGPPC